MKSFLVLTDDDLESVRFNVSEGEPSPAAQN